MNRAHPEPKTPPPPSPPESAEPRLRCWGWVLGALGLLIVVGASFLAGYWLGGRSDGGDRADVLARRREQLIGGWQRQDENGRIVLEFTADGGVGIANVDREGNARLSFQGIYRLLDGETLLLQLRDANPPQGKAPTEQSRMMRLVSISAGELVLETASGRSRFERMRAPLSSSDSPD